VLGGFRLDLNDLQQIVGSSGGVQLRQVVGRQCEINTAAFNGFLAPPLRDRIFLQKANNLIEGKWITALKWVRGLLSATAL
jgi:hypothetical protein